MEVGISTASFYPEALTEETIPLISELGVKQIEVFLSGYSEYQMQFCKALRSEIDRYGLTVYSVHALGTQFEPQVFSPSQRQRKDSQDIFLKVFKCAQILGAKAYVFHGPAVHLNRKANIDFKRAGPISDELANLAADHGIKFSWENVSWCWFFFPEFADRILENTKSENLFFTLDIKQAMQTGRSTFDFLEHMGERLINIHAIDFKDDKSLTLPGRGIFDFRRLHRELETLNYKGPLFMEVYRSNYGNYNDLGQSLDYLRGIFSS